MERSSKPQPAQQLLTSSAEDAKTVLSANWGGRREVRKAYCLFYYERPRNLYANMQCYGYVDEVTGNRLTPICPDFERCKQNPAGSGSKKKPYDCLTVPDPISRKK